jgi:hypothetical protein
MGAVQFEGAQEFQAVAKSSTPTRLEVPIKAETSRRFRTLVPVRESAYSRKLLTIVPTKAFTEYVERLEKPMPVVGLPGLSREYSTSFETVAITMNRMYRAYAMKSENDVEYLTTVLRMLDWEFT